MSRKDFQPTAANRKQRALDRSERFSQFLESKADEILAAAEKRKANESYRSIMAK